MPSLKDLRNRIVSVKSTRKITRAMQLVAASKLKRAQDAAEAARPYAEKMQGVLANTVRVRISGTQGWLTIKGAGEGSSRAEFEYPLPLSDATDLLDHLCMRPQIDKTRHLIPHGGLTFEVDVFHGENEGLIMAEVELSAVDTHVDLPPWIGVEVTGDHRYFNAYLAQHPFSSWSSHGL